jgi:hypothetical protein
MQSGRKNTKKWLMKPIEESGVRSVNSLTGWISASNTNSQLHFEFLNKEDAIKFAESRNFSYEIFEPKSAALKKKSYAENFTG